MIETPTDEYVFCPFCGLRQTPTCYRYFEGMRSLKMARLICRQCGSGADIYPITDYKPKPRN